MSQKASTPSDPAASLTPTRRAGRVILVAVAVASVIGLLLWVQNPRLFAGAAVAELFVAGGTAALAASAYYTIEWDREKHEEERQWQREQRSDLKFNQESERVWRETQRLDRRQDREPHVEILRVTKVLVRPLAPREQSLETELGDFLAAVLILRNNGPGIAANFKATRTQRLVPGEFVQDLQRYWPEERRRLSRDDLARDESNIEFLHRAYLRAGEDVELTSPDEWVTVPDPVADRVYGTLWKVECTDLEGNPATPAVGGLLRGEALAPNRYPSDEVEWDRSFHRTRSRWRFISSFKELPPNPTANREAVSAEPTMIDEG
jgi:hypothetical protein